MNTLALDRNVFVFLKATPVEKKYKKEKFGKVFRGAVERAPRNGLDTASELFL